MYKSQLSVGQEVSVDHKQYKGIWTVKKLNPTTAVLVSVAGGPELRAPYALLVEPSGSLRDATARRYYSCGELVRVSSGKFAGLYVVIADKGANQLNVAKLGGDNGQYVRINRTSVTLVDPSAVLMPSEVLA